MLNFQEYVGRHGEVGVQAIIEKLERYEGVSPVANRSLEERWNFLMKVDHYSHALAA